jgi:hypothetical protein
MSIQDKFAGSLKDVKEVQTFTRDLIIHLSKRNIRPTPGEDLTKRAEELKLNIPEVFRGSEITWEPRHEIASDEAGNGSVLVLAGPGTPEAIGLTIGCIRVRSWKICLECGWFYCRIVIKGTF